MKAEGSRRCWRRESESVAAWNTNAGGVRQGECGGNLLVLAVTLAMITMCLNLIVFNQMSGIEESGWTSWPAKST